MWIQVGAGEQQAGPRKRRGERQDPPGHVEHGHHREDCVPPGDRKGVRQHGGQRGQHHRPVGVQDPLRAACGPRGVTHHGRSVLGKVGVRERLEGPLHQLLVGAVRRGNRSACEGDHENPFQPDVLPELLEQGEQDVVHDEETGLRVVHDVRQLSGVQTQIQRVQDGSRDGDAEVALQVGSVVPAQGGHTLPGPDAQPGEGPGQEVGPLGKGRVGGPVQRAVWPPRHHVHVPPVAGHPLQHPGQGQGIRHGGLPRKLVWHPRRLRRPHVLSYGPTGRQLPRARRPSRSAPSRRGTPG